MESGNAAGLGGGGCIFWIGGTRENKMVSQRVKWEDCCLVMSK